MRVLVLAAVGLVGWVALQWSGQAQADYLEREDVQAYVAELQTEHGFTKSELEGWFGQAEQLQTVLDAIARPAERTLGWHEYRPIFLKAKSYERGLEFWQAHEATLARAQATYGVPAEIIVAIIGVETRWGRIMGKYRVLDSLMTLGFDYPPRSKFFRGQLTELLLLAREEKTDLTQLKGSYAGAMGFGQFIPSSFRDFAVDFDGDGVRDIWTNPTDAIGSVANYFAEHGWTGEHPAVIKVQVSDPSKVAELANEGLALERTVAELRGLGVKIPDLPGELPAALFKMELAVGAEYWLGLPDFYAITRYNHSRLYALAVYQLGRAIKVRREKVRRQKERRER